MVVAWFFWVSCSNLMSNPQNRRPTATLGPVAAMTAMTRLGWWWPLRLEMRVVISDMGWEPQRKRSKMSFYWKAVQCCLILKFNWALENHQKKTSRVQRDGMQTKVICQKKLLGIDRTHRNRLRSLLKASLSWAQHGVLGLVHRWLLAGVLTAIEWAVNRAETQVWWDMESKRHDDFDELSSFWPWRWVPMRGKLQHTFLQ